VAVQARKGRHGTSYRVLYYDLDGKVHSGGTFGTRKEAQHEYGRLKSEVNRGLMPWLPQVDVYRGTVRGQGTVAGWAEAWLPGHRLAAHSRASYAQVLKNHVLPAIGSKPLRDVTAADIRGQDGDEPEV
jgi:Phage integrase, N-terminal SAM-like domain